MVNGVRTDPDQALAVRALVTIRRLLLKWPHLHQLWVDTWEHEKQRSHHARPHGPVGTLRRILHRWGWGMELLTDKDLPVHLLKAPRGWLRGLTTVRLGPAAPQERPN